MSPKPKFLETTKATKHSNDKVFAAFVFFVVKGFFEPQINTDEHR